MRCSLVAKGSLAAKPLGPVRLSNCQPARPRAKVVTHSYNADDPREVLGHILELFKQGGKLQEVVNYLPDEHKKAALQRPYDPSAEQNSVFGNVVEMMLLQKPDTHFLDSYALRSLVLAPPASSQELSGLQLCDWIFVSRHAVCTPSGEESVLTFHLRDVAAIKAPYPKPQSHLDQQDFLAQVQDSLTSNRDVYRPKPQRAWRLSKVTGESRYALVPSTPSPEFSPESIVAAQLAALKEFDFSQVFALMSPAAQSLVGPLDRFISSMARSRAYRVLVDHKESHSVRRCQSSASSYLEVVAVEGTARDAEVFCWIVRRQSEPGPLHDCWLTEWVKVVDDPKLLHTLGYLPHGRKRKGGRSDEGPGQQGGKAGGSG